MITGGLITRLDRFVRGERPELIRFAEIAADRGETIWLVGGILRDAALGRILSDVDIAVSGDASALARRCAESLGGAFVPLHDNPATVRVVHEGFEYDFVALRAPTIAEDLRARDLCINSMAAKISPQGVGDILDPTGGMDDAANGVIRSLSSRNMTSDPLRALRIFRFAAQLDFSVDEQTLAWAQDAATQMDGVAGERIFAELIKLLSADGSAQVLRSAQKYHVLPRVIPDLEKRLSFSMVENFDAWPQACRNLFDDYDKLSATMENDELCADAPVMKSAALFGEMPGGAQALKKSCVRWKAPRRYADTVAKILDLQSMVADGAAEIREESDKLRIFARYTRRAEKAWLAAAALALARGGASENAYVEFFHDLVEAHRDIIAAVDAGPPLVDGSRLIDELQIAPGPVVGRLLDAIREERICGAIKSADEALAFARRLLAEELPQIT